MTSRGALAFIRRHGVVLEGARGPVPTLAEAVVGAPIRGSWWGHAKGHEIFWLTRAVRDSRDVLVCRLVRVRSPMCIVGCGQRSCVWLGASHVTIWPRCTRCTRGGGVTSYGWCRSRVGCGRTLSVERAV